MTVFKEVPKNSHKQPFLITGDKPQFTIDNCTNMKKNKYLFAIIMAGIFFTPTIVTAVETDNLQQSNLPELYGKYLDESSRYGADIMLPNIHPKSLTTPTAWGAANGVLFFGIGGTVNAPYDDEADGAAVVGVGFGDPTENLGAQIALFSLDLDSWDRYSASAHIHRDLGGGSAIGAGVENIVLLEGNQPDDEEYDESYYIVFSQSVQSDVFLNKHCASKLHFSIGIGSGRFGEKSDADVQSGKDRYGTYIFGNVAYEMFDEFNAILDWNGLNLNAGVGKTFWIDQFPLSVTLGAADLTDNSGDETRFIFALATGFKL